MRELVFGPMPEGATPQTHLAAGPWCFVGQEAQFPFWSGNACGQKAGDVCGQKTGDACGHSACGADQHLFPLLPDPYADAAALDAAGLSANAAARRLALEYGARSNAASGKKLSDAYWILLLGPFFLLIAHMLAERQKRVQDMLEHYGKEPLRVPVLPADCAFSFQNTQDCLVHGVLDLHFNWYVYSRLLDHMAPAAWRLESIEGVALHQAKDAKTTACGKNARLARLPIRRRIANLLRDMPFPRYKGFSLWQAGLLSLAALTNTRSRPEAELDFSLYCGTETAWAFDFDALALACLPLDMRNAHMPDKQQSGILSGRRPCEQPGDQPGDQKSCQDRKKAQPCAGPARPGPLRGMTPAFMQDDVYRARLACLRERGCRLFAVQHGANYGNLRSIGVLPFEYARHAFFTWGWSAHAGLPANATPLPHPLLLRHANAHREQGPLLILVGAEMSAFSYRLKSRPQAGSLPAYRNSKVTFLRTVRDGLKQHGLEGELAYRPYFAAPGALDDGPFITRALPDMPLCQGDLTAHMLSCRLLVLDHYGTTLHMALAANTPLMAYWDKNAWAMEPASQAALDALRKAGILFDSAQEAAHGVLACWQNVTAWWQHPTRQQARQLWLDNYARITDAKAQPLSMWKLTGAWWKALRNI